MAKQEQVKQNYAAIIDHTGQQTGHVDIVNGRPVTTTGGQKDNKATTPKDPQAPSGPESPEAVPA